MQVTFRKVVLKDIHRQVKGGKVSCSAAMTAPVKEAMGWGDIPDWETSCTPLGRLIATKIELEPKAGIGMSAKNVELDTSLIDSFEVVKIETKGKQAKKLKSTRVELRFNVHFPDPGGAGKLEKYMLTTGNEGSMNVVYEREPEQTEMEPAAEGDSKQGTLEDLVEETARKKKAAKE